MKEKFKSVEELQQPAVELESQELKKEQILCLLYPEKAMEKNLDGKRRKIIVGYTEDEIKSLTEEQKKEIKEKTKEVMTTLSPKEDFIATMNSIIRPHCDYEKIKPPLITRITETFKEIRDLSQKKLNQAEELNKELTQAEKLPSDPEKKWKKKWEVIRLTHHSMKLEFVARSYIDHILSIAHQIEIEEDITKIKELKRDLENEFRRAEITCNWEVLKAKILEKAYFGPTKAKVSSLPF